MKVHLDEVIAGVRAKTSMIEKEINDHEERLLVGLFLRASEHAICFHAGDINDIKDLRPIGELLRLPYPTCWIEGSIYNEKISRMGHMGAMLQQMDGKVASLIFSWNDHRPIVLHGLVTWSMEDGGSTRLRQEIFPPSAADTLREGVRWITRFLTALNCCNVTRVEHSPPPKVNQARAKKGKQPLFSFWTLDLAPADGTNAYSMGGTHAAPRVHLRRGHIKRRQGSDKWWWVQPHMVGRNSPSAGIVHKNYDASALVGEPS